VTVCKEQLATKSFFRQAQAQETGSGHFFINYTAATTTTREFAGMCDSCVHEKVLFQATFGCALNDIGKHPNVGGMPKQLPLWDCYKWHRKIFFTTLHVILLLD